MQVICKSVLAFKNCQAVFRSHSSGALPVLAITGFAFIYKTNRKPYIFRKLRSSSSSGSTGAEREHIWGTLWGPWIARVPPWNLVIGWPRLHIL